MRFLTGEFQLARATSDGWLLNVSFLPLGPVSWPPGGLAPRSGSNQSGHARADITAWLGTNAARRHWHSSHASAAIRSYHCLKPRIEAGLPWDACLLHEQNAIERCFIAHFELLCATFDGRHEGWDGGCNCRHSSLLTGCLARGARSIISSG